MILNKKKTRKKKEIFISSIHTHFMSFLSFFMSLKMNGNNIETNLKKIMVGINMKMTKRKATLYIANFRWMEMMKN